MAELLKSLSDFSKELLEVFVKDSFLKVSLEDFLKNNLDHGLAWNRINKRFNKENLKEIL